MREDGNVVLEIESLYRRLAERNNVAIVGSYDPIKAGCGESEFFDGMHPTSSCMKKIVDKVNF